MFAARYGYDLEGFYCLTLRQIYSLKRVIERTKREDLRVQASLHGKELKHDLPEPLMVDKETQDKRDRQAKDLLQRMKKRHQDRQQRDGKRQ